MGTNKYTHVRYFIFVCFLFSLVILTACKPNASARKIFPDLKEWDLLIISDSMNWRVGQNYAKLIESDMNVKVTLHDCWVGGLSIGAVLNALQSGGTLYPYVDDQSCYKPLPDLVKEAEVMVLYGNPVDSIPPDDSWNFQNASECVWGGYEGKNLLPGFETYKENMLKSCAPEKSTYYKADLGAVIEEIDKIREGRPLILRMTTFYIAWHPSWLKNGLDEVCTTCIGHSSEPIRQVAAEHGVPVADTMVVLNGKDYMSEIPAGYLKDGIHPSDAGAQFIATLLQKTGYE